MPAGRPTEYSDEYPEKVRKLCLLGATDPEIADFFEVSVATISNWKIAHPEFMEAIKEGKRTADANVANRLYCRAMGYEHDSEEIKVIGNEVVRVPVRKHYPPDTTAGIFWLKNRSKANWREKTETDLNVSGEISFVAALREAQRIKE